LDCNLLALGSAFGGIGTSMQATHANNGSSFQLRFQRLLHRQVFRTCLCGLGFGLPPVFAIPLRDLYGVAVWCAGLFGAKWNGEAHASGCCGMAAFVRPMLPPGLRCISAMRIASAQFPWHSCRSPRRYRGDLD
jgi:hypothetical protein